MGVTMPIQLTNSSEIKLWEAPQSSNAVNKLLKHLKGKWSNFDGAFVLIHPITGSNASVTGVPIVSFLVQSMLEVDPMGDLLEADMYTVVEVPDAAVVWACTNDPKYQDCYCDPNVGLMGHEDLMVTLGHNINNAVVVVTNVRATEVWKIIFFVLSDDNRMWKNLFCHNHGMLDVCPNGIKYSSWAIYTGHLQHPNSQVHTLCCYFQIPIKNRPNAQFALPTCMHHQMCRDFLYTPPFELLFTIHV